MGSGAEAGRRGRVNRFLNQVNAFGFSFLTFLNVEICTVLKKVRLGTWSKSKLLCAHFPLINGNRNLCLTEKLKRSESVQSPPAPVSPESVTAARDVVLPRASALPVSARISRLCARKREALPRAQAAQHTSLLKLTSPLRGIKDTSLFSSWFLKFSSMLLLPTS